ncbi:hypothetical protein MMC16_006552 [Acarospora aff. strigata]|nr:hypothetical protein [Acarospora aff. strigata]
MATFKRQQPNGLSPSIVYGLAGGVGGLILIIVVFYFARRERRKTKRARERLNSAREWELANLTPSQRNSPDNISLRARQARFQQSIDRIDLSSYADRPLPPVPIRTRSRPSNPALTVPSHLDRPRSQTRSQIIDRLSASNLQPRPTSTRPPLTAVEAILLDQGATTSDTSAFDIEPSEPVVNEAYARARMEQDAILARLGYTESEAMLASDIGLPSSDDALDAERELEPDRERQRMRERVVRNAAAKVNITNKAKARGRSVESPATARWAGAAGVGEDIREESDGTGPGTPRRARSRGEPPRSTGTLQVPRPPPARQAKSTERERQPATSTLARHRDPVLASVSPPTGGHGPTWQVDPPTPPSTSFPPPARPWTDDDILNEGSVDSSRFSQLDLGTSTEDGTYVSTDISDDPWREEVRANRRRWR